jgi:hypothetical protein
MIGAAAKVGLRNEDCPGVARSIATTAFRQGASRGRRRCRHTNDFDDDFRRRRRRSNPAARVTTQRDATYSYGAVTPIRRKVTERGRVGTMRRGKLLSSMDALSVVVVT